MGQRGKGRLLLVALGVFYGMVKSPSWFHFFLTDENIYFCLARGVSLQNLYYRDFFYANPPLLLPILKLSGTLFSWSAFGLRAVPFVASLAAGLWVAHTFLRGDLGLKVVLPVFLFWMAHDSIRASTHATGINLVLFLIVFSYILACNRKFALAGIFFGAALWTKAYAVVGFPALLFAVWDCGRSDWKNSWKAFLLGLGGTAGLLILHVGWIDPAAFWEMNVSYHLAKPPGKETILEAFVAAGRRDRAALTAMALVALRAVWVGARQPRTGWKPRAGTPPLRWTVIGLVHTLAATLFLTLQNRLFDFYFLLYLPGLVFLCAGLLALEESSPAGMEDTRKSGLREVAFVALAGFLLLQPLIPGRYRWIYSEADSYWEHESRNIDGLAEWKDRLEGPPGTTLCGDSATASLLSVLSGVPLALGEADTNAMRFRAGLPSPAEFIRRLEEVRVEYLLIRVGYTSQGRAYPTGMFVIPEFLEYAQRSFDPAGVLRLNEKDEVRLMKRKRSAGEISG